ncbi:MAG TPA: hypothetical protein VFO34_02060, partial [Candidatus Acidoferrales bacterium]|nr:hypothetical protein [Candidatus Acidoferrales bacterium]
LRFPLRFSSFFALNIAYGLADPLALTAIVWHFAMWVGIVSARPDLGAPVALVAAASIVMNLAFGRMAYAWLERFLSQRRTRELLFVVFMLIVFAFQFTGVVLQRYRGPILRLYRATSPVLNSLPPGESGESVVSFARGDFRGALLQTGAVLIFALVFAALFAHRLHRQFLGESFSESGDRVGGTQRKAATARPALVVIPSGMAGATSTSGAQRRAVGGATGAILEKELRYLFRNSILMMNLFIPVILVAVISFSAAQQGHRSKPGHGFHLPPELIYSAGVAYAFMIMLPQVCMNCFAYDGEGVQLLYLAPVKFREVMLGKNLFQGAMLLVEALLVLGLITAISGPPPFIAILTTWTGAAFLALVHISAGNWFSLKFPRRFEFGVRRQQLSGISVLAYFGTYLGSVAILGIVALLVRFLAGPWTVVAVYAGLVVAAFSVYRTLLNLTTSQAIAQRDALIGQIVRASQ